MNDRRVLVCIALVTGLALTTLLLWAGSATASPFSPVAPATQPHAVGATSWGSPWAPITTGQTITFYHNLGGDPDDYAVELWFRDTDDGLGINRRNYGGMEANGNWYGAHWQNLTTNTIQVYRQPDDNAADLVRIRIWVPSATPDYASPWTVITPGHTITFSHNVGITATDLTVGLWFSGTTRGIHHFGFGGLAVDSLTQMWGAHWQNLTTNTVQVFRPPDDTDVEQVRLIVVHGAPPDYDSSWQDIQPGTRVTFTHGLNWSPNMLLVRGECYDLSGLLGIHKLFAGGNHDWFGGGNFRGVNLESLTSNTVTAFRWGDDEFCSQVRIRIWKRGARIYLPLVLRDY